MNETLKRNWKPITAFALALSAVGAAAYYVNFIYIPGKERARAAELTAAQVVPETPKNYNFHHRHLQSCIYFQDQSRHEFC